jgi:hypothetical protein
MARPKTRGKGTATQGGKRPAMQPKAPAKPATQGRYEPKPDAEEWIEAEAQSVAHLRFKFPKLSAADAAGIARDAATQAWPNWRREAPFAVLVKKTAYFEALRHKRISQRTIALDPDTLISGDSDADTETASERPKARARIDHEVMERYFLPTAQRVENLLFQVSPEKLALGLYYSLIPVSKLAERKGLTAEDGAESPMERAGLCLIAVPEEPIFVESMRFEIERVSRGTWMIESAANLDDMPELPAVGRPEKDRYWRRHDEKLPEEVRSAWAEMRRRHAAILTDNKEKQVAEHIVRFAMGLCGIDGRMIRGALSRVEKRKSRRAQFIADTGRRVSFGLPLPKRLAI